MGLNEVAEKGFPVEQLMDLGFGGCRISLPAPEGSPTRVRSSSAEKRGDLLPYDPRPLLRREGDQGRDPHHRRLRGNRPAVGMADGIFDIVSSGGTLISNGLKEVEKVFFSEAVLSPHRGLTGKNASKSSSSPSVSTRYSTAAT